jgi:hypothetical protein
MTNSLQRIQRLAWLLDNSLPIPGTRIRIGLDPLIGLIPGAGDLIGALLSGYIVAESARLGASRSTLLRMAWNVLVETAVGLIPLLGDLFDAGWKANQRNIALLERHLEVPALAGSRDRGFIALMVTGTALAVGGILAGGFFLLRWLFNL